MIVTDIANNLHEGCAAVMKTLPNYEGSWQIALHIGCLQCYILFEIYYKYYVALIA